jgi:hypothetical protein
LIIRYGEVKKVTSKEKNKVLILSATFEEGDQQVTYSVHEAKQLCLADVELVVFDFLALAYFSLYPIFHYT